MTHPSLEIVHGSPFALRHDGSGHDPVDGRFAEEWVTVLRLIGDQFEPLRIAISQVISGKVKSAKGYRFRFAK